MKKNYFIWIWLVLLSITIQTVAQNATCIGSPTSRLVTGEQAQVIAEGGSNLRARPSANATLLAIIPTSNIIPVVTGPFCADGYAWWQVDYSGERGWVAEGINDFYWLAPYIIQRAQIGDIRIEIQPTLVSNVMIERLPEPARSQFVLTRYPIESQLIVPFIVIFDTIPDSISETQQSTDSARVTPIADGTRFIDLQFADDASTEADIELVYRYTATLADNRYVDAYLPITALFLPFAYDLPDDDQETYQENYITLMREAINAFADDDFVPSLSALDSIILSLQYDAPLDTSDLLTYANNGIQFDYHPTLSTQITETLIDEVDTVPQHILLNFADYPAGQGTIRVYRSEDIAGNSLITMQQVLQRQSANPPRIPIPSQIDAPSSRDDLSYLPFGNGTGIRYFATFDDNQFYSYQGLSDDGRYFVSALFSQDIADGLALDMMLDNLMRNFTVGD